MPHGKLSKNIYITLILKECFHCRILDVAYSQDWVFTMFPFGTFEMLCPLFLLHFCYLYPGHQENNVSYPIPTPFAVNICLLCGVSSRLVMSVACLLCFPVVHCASFRFASATEYLDINSSNSPHSQSLFSFLLTIPVHVYWAFS